MPPDNPLSVPAGAPSLGDVAHSLVVKAALSAVPVVGPFVSELAQMVVVSPAQKRMGAFLEDVVERISALESSGIPAARLESDEGFQDVLAAAIDAGRRSASEQKRLRLLNCVTSSGQFDVPADKQRFYVRCVDELTDGHFTVLQRFRSREFHPARFSQMLDDEAEAQMLERLGWAADEGSYLSALLLDLASKGLLVIVRSAGTSLGSNNFQRMHCSSVGEGLVDFVS